MYNPKKRNYQNVKDIMDISEQRLALDTEFLQKGKEMEDLEKHENIENRIEEDELSESDLKDYILYLDENNESEETLQELKKNKDLKLNVLIYRKSDLLEIPLWLSGFPFLVDKKNKKAFANDQCIDFIKTVKVCKQRMKTGTKTLVRW
jgi:hypothetical protein